MSEREKKVLEAITQAIPALNEFSKGYVSGYLAAKEEAGASVKEDKPKQDGGEKLDRDDGKEG